MVKIIDDDFFNIKKKLKEYINLDGTELGELCDLLLSLENYSSYFCSEKFEEMIIEEIKEQYKNFKNNCEIVEEEETYTITHKTLEWNNYGKC